MALPEHGQADEGEKWYYHVSTGEVVQGRRGGWEDRMGPYDTAVEARDALKRAKERSEAFDEQDEEWDS